MQPFSRNLNRVIKMYYLKKFNKNENLGICMAFSYFTKDSIKANP